MPIQLISRGAGSVLLAAGMAVAQARGVDARSSPYPNKPIRWVTSAKTE